jgi:autotransporter passenger strand-loop-strand repeat protein
LRKSPTFLAGDIPRNEEVHLASGQETALRGGRSSGADIMCGGGEIVSSGGSALATTISGGTLEVASGGSAGGSSSEAPARGHCAGRLGACRAARAVECRQLFLKAGLQHSNLRDTLWV